MKTQNLKQLLSNYGCITALRMALGNHIKSTPLVHHSDCGVQYCSYDYVGILRRHKWGKVTKIRLQKNKIDVAAHAANIHG